MKSRISVAILLMSIPTIVFATTSVFSRPLKLGMSGEDVRTLQVLLNKDAITRIAEIGAGSPGNETNYFGLATKRAVIKFQEKYREEILTPLGLYLGTGFLGGKTNAKVAALLQKVTGFSVAQTNTSLATTDSLKKLDTFPRIEKYYFNITRNGAATLGEYYSKYANITKEVSFSQDELNIMKKRSEVSNENGQKGDKLLLLEELIEVAKKEGNSKELKVSFMAWANLDKRVVAELKKIPIKQSIFETNQEIASWFQYHGLIAERFGGGSLNFLEMENLAKEFKTYAAEHIGLYGESIAKAQKKDPAFFTFINKAEASGCGLLQFGGRITGYTLCNLGTIHAVIGTCGGAVLFTWAVQAANPFLWHNIYTPGVAVLGKSVINPAQVCPLGFPPFVTFIPASDIAIFYGTSLVI